MTDLATDDQSSQLALTPAEEGIDHLRTTAKWLIAAFAAVGVALVAGIQLTNFGQAKPVWAAAAGYALGLIGVATAILAASGVLRADSLSAGQLASSSTAKQLRNAVVGDPGLLEGQASSLGDLNAKLIAARRAADGAWEQPGADQPGSTRDNALRLEERQELLQGLVDRLADYGLYLNTTHRFVVARRWIVCAATLCAVGLGLFSWATSRPKDPDDPKAPQLVTVRINADHAAEFEVPLGRNCDLRAIKAVLVGGTLRDPEIVTLPQDGCAAMRFVLPPDVGVATVP